MALAEHSLPQQLAVERCRALAIDALSWLQTRLFEAFGAPARGF